MAAPATDAERDAAERLLVLEAGAAWFEYLEQTRRLDGPSSEVEVWAWIRLQGRLEELAQRYERRFG